MAQQYHRNPAAVSALSPDQCHLTQEDGPCARSPVNTWTIRTQASTSTRSLANRCDPPQ